MVYNSQMTPQPSQRKRKKRFERDPDHVPSMRLTERDVAIIRHVSRHRFLNSKQIITLVGESPRIVRRLEAMFRCGYLDRPKAQLVYYGKAGSEPLVYAEVPRPKTGTHPGFCNDGLSLRRFRLPIQPLNVVM